MSLKDLVFQKVCFLRVLSKNTITIFYFKKQNLIVFKTNIEKKCLILNQMLNILIVKDKILIFVNPTEKLSKIKTQLFYSTKKIILNYFKQCLIEMELNIFNKLSLNGVGFKVFKTNYNKILMFKLGFSHPIYFKLNCEIKILKNTKLLFKSNSFQKNKQLLSKIRLLKQPEPYKGKGIFFDKEKIILKEGKKN